MVGTKRKYGGGKFWGSTVVEISDEDGPKKGNGYDVKPLVTGNHKRMVGLGQENDGFSIPSKRKGRNLVPTCIFVDDDDDGDGARRNGEVRGGDGGRGIEDEVDFGYLMFLESVGVELPGFGGNYRDRRIGGVGVCEEKNGGGVGSVCPDIAFGVSGNGDVSISLSPSVGCVSNVDVVGAGDGAIAATNQVGVGLDVFVENNGGAEVARWDVGGGSNISVDGGNGVVRSRDSENGDVICVSSDSGVGLPESVAHRAQSKVGGGVRDGIVCVTSDGVDDCEGGDAKIAGNNHVGVVVGVDVSVECNGCDGCGVTGKDMDRGAVSFADCGNGVVESGVGEDGDVVGVSSDSSIDISELVTDGAWYFGVNDDRRDAAAAGNKEISANVDSFVTTCKEAMADVCGLASVESADKLSQDDVTGLHVCSSDVLNSSDNPIDSLNGGASQLSAKNGGVACKSFDDGVIDVEALDNGKTERLHSPRDHYIDIESLGNVPYNSLNDMQSRGVVEDTSNYCPNNDKHSDIDADYKLFLERLRICGNSYTLDISVGDGVSLVLAYETSDCPDGGFDQNYKANLTKGRIGTKRKCSGVSACKVKSSLYRKKRAKEPVSTKANVQVKKTPDTEDVSFNVSHSEPKEITELVDKSYEIFLNSLKKEADRVVFAPVNGEKMFYSEKMFYGEDEQDLGDADVIILESNPFVHQKDIPLVILDDDVGGQGPESSPWQNCSRQRDMLIEILKKPYNENELRDLHERFILRKPVVGYRHLRNECKAYDTNKMGQSYEDLHKGLAEKVKASSCNKPKVLNLLRGFFYWLEKLVGQATPPWLDPLCLEVLPSETFPSSTQRIQKKIQPLGIKSEPSTLASGPIWLA